MRKLFLAVFAFIAAPLIALGAAIPFAGTAAAVSGEFCRNTSYTDGALMNRQCIDQTDVAGSTWRVDQIKVFNIPLSQGGHSDTTYVWERDGVCSIRCVIANVPVADGATFIYGDDPGESTLTLPESVTEWIHTCQEYGTNNYVQGRHVYWNVGGGTSATQEPCFD